MKALTLTQPWATLVAIGAKRIETRSWETMYRGPLAIHAAKGFPKWAKETCCEPLFHEALYTAGYEIGMKSFEILPLGGVVATCRLVTCKLIVEPGSMSGGNSMIAPREPEQSFGDYAPGRFAWLLEDVEQLPEPIPAKGAPGLWEWEPPSDSTKLESPTAGLADYIGGTATGSTPQKGGVR